MIHFLYMFEYKDLRYPSHKTSNEDTNYQIQIWPNIYLYHPGMFVVTGNWTDRDTEFSEQELL